MVLRGGRLSLRDFQSYNHLAGLEEFLDDLRRDHPDRLELTVQNLAPFLRGHCAEPLLSEDEFSYLAVRYRVNVYSNNRR